LPVQRPALALLSAGASTAISGLPGGIRYRRRFNPVKDQLRYKRGKNRADKISAQKKRRKKEKKIV